VTLQSVVKIDAPRVSNIRELLGRVEPLLIDATFVLANDLQILYTFFGYNLKT
jgi:hypothetical protein